MPDPLSILLPSDVFPPRSGGAGWSAHALALALIDRGHRVRAVVPQPGLIGDRREEVLGVPVLRTGYRVSPIPFVKNYARHERLWPRLAEKLEQEARASGWDSPAPRSGDLRSRLIIHAQHVQAAPAAVIAASRLGVPALVTVRDHWPWDYFATGLHGDRLPYERASWPSVTTDLLARLGPLRGSLALPAVPYVLAHLRRRQLYLRRADAVIAVSRYIAGRLASLVAPDRLHVIPNMVDIEAIDRAVAAPAASVPAGQPFLLYVGKLEPNKGAQLLVEVFRALHDQGRPSTAGRRSMSGAGGASDAVRGWPLVVAGSGPLRAELERELGALGVQVRFLDWADHDEVLRLMARCELLLFPSAWGEPLSRVLLEAAACGAPILAMPTGGTADIIRDGLTGALEPTPQGFALRMARLLDDPAGRAALGAGARRAAAERFCARRVVERVETLYRDLLSFPT